MIRKPFRRRNDFEDDEGGERGLQGRRRPSAAPIKRRPCRFCADYKIKPDYKNAKILCGLISDRGRIVPRRISGNCAYHQRKLTQQIKRARSMAILPFTATQRPISESRPVV